ncbi:serine/threonine-protein kinase [Melittangium boletus]|uniref:serine/threonine-protein kinase n=1 Tax=Melittangium boletus TaxID=83453 RepID=UPI003DA35334
MANLKRSPEGEPSQPSGPVRVPPRDEGGESLSRALDVLEAELERARVVLCQGEHEPTGVVGAPAPLPEEPQPLPPGTLVGRYVVHERLGAGGMGEVYAAFDPHLSRRVALKLLLPGGSDRSQARLRLMREAQAMARLSHPHVLPVFDIGEHGDQVFIALEHVAGRTLRQWLKEEPRPWRQVLQVLTRAGQGLAAAHAAGLVHRDFKPDNVLVGHDGRVLVYDFGLACEQGTGSPGAPVPVDLTALLGAPEPPPDADAFADLQTREPRETPVTRAGLIMGTPGYMAPEQYRHEPLTGQADQFSFCATLHFALYGEHAFEGHGAAALARATLAGQLRAPPRDSDVPEWVRRVVRQGLSLSPAGRHASMEALLDALQEEPGSGLPRQVMLAVAAAFLVAVVAGAATQWNQRQGLCHHLSDRLTGVWDAPRQEAVRRAFLATGQPYAPSAWTSVKTALDGYASAWVERQRHACEATYLTGRASEERFAARTACLERRRSEFKALTALLAVAEGPEVEHAVEAVRGLSELGPCDEAAMLTERAPPPTEPAAAARVEALYTELARARALRISGQYAAGLAVATPVAASARAQAYAPLKAEALLELGQQQRGFGDPAAEQTLQEAAWTADEVGLDEVRAEALVALTQFIAYDTARVKDGHDWFHQARALLVRTRRQGRLLAQLESAHGLLYGAQGDPVAAEASQRNALAEWDKAALPESPEHASLLRHLGLTLSAQGRHEEALSVYRRAHGAYVQTLGDGHPRVGSALVNLGGSLSALGRPEALPTLREGVAIVERTLPPRHPFRAVALETWGLALVRADPGEEAVQVLRRAVAAAEGARGPRHPDVASPCDGLGRVLLERGRAAEALEPFTRALGLRERALGREHPELAASLTGQGEALWSLGRSHEALVPLRRALALRESHAVPPEDLAQTRFALARAMMDARLDAKQARALAEQAALGFEGPGSRAALTRVQRWLGARHP